MNLIVNGQPRQVPDGASVAQLIEQLGLAGAACAAELNRTLIPKRDHPTTTLREGDRVELVSLVGGG